MSFWQNYAKLGLGRWLTYHLSSFICCSRGSFKPVSYIINQPMWKGHLLWCQVYIVENSPSQWDTTGIDAGWFSCLPKKKHLAMPWTNSVSWMGCSGQKDPNHFWMLIWDIRWYSYISIKLLTISPTFFKTRNSHPIVPILGVMCQMQHWNLAFLILLFSFWMSHEMGLCESRAYDIPTSAAMEDNDNDRKTHWILGGSLFSGRIFTVLRSHLEMSTMAVSVGLEKWCSPVGWSRPVRGLERDWRSTKQRWLNLWWKSRWFI